MIDSTTISDVARTAGVSVGTVSRVLNGHANITQRNFDRVQKAIKELGYKKYRSPKHLVSRRNGGRAHTGNIGMIYTEMSGNWVNHPLVTAYTMGVERACQEKGFHAMIEFPENGESLPRCVKENKVDGLLIKPTRRLPGYLDNIPKGLPVVCVGLNEPSAPIQQVAPDNRSGGWLVAEYLWSLGHRRIGFVCSVFRHPMFLDRFQGYKDFLRSKLEFDPAICSLNESDQIDKFPESHSPDMSGAVKKLLSASGAPVTAIVAANDWMACGLYSALAKADRQVAEDISVVGFDNNEMICAELQPPLTSFAIPFGDVAYAAALSVIERIQTPNQLWSRSLNLIRGEIIERASVRSLNESRELLQALRPSLAQ